MSDNNKKPSSPPSKESIPDASNRPSIDHHQHLPLNKRQVSRSSSAQDGFSQNYHHPKSPLQGFNDVVSVVGEGATGKGSVRSGSMPLAPKAHPRLNNSSKPASFEATTFCSLVNGAIKWDMKTNDVSTNYLEQITPIMPERCDETLAGEYHFAGQEALAREKKNAQFMPYIPSMLQSPRRLIKKWNEYKKMEIFDSFEGISGLDFNGVLIAYFLNALLDIQGQKFLLSEISKCNNLQVLVLNSCGIRSLAGLKLSKLQSADLIGNQIPEADLLFFLSACTSLEALNIEVPSIDLYHRILFACPNLRIINDAPLPVEEKIKAIELHGNEQDKQNIEFFRWDFAVCIQSVQTMTTCSLEAITELILVNCGLKEFHVGALENLKLLNLSNNQIATIRNRGLEHCDNLERLHLDNNNLSLIKDLAVFGNMKGLGFLSIKNNPFKDDVRAAVIFLTRYLPGTKYENGLRELDGKPVSLSEKLSALHTFGQNINVDLESWLYFLVSVLGSTALSNAEKRNSLKHLVLKRQGINYADVSIFPNLVYLDFSSSAIKQIKGLETCKSLQHLDLSLNKDLVISDILTVVKEAKFEYLEDFSVGMKLDSRRDKLNQSIRLQNSFTSTRGDSLRITILHELVPVLKRLAVVNGSMITAEERFESMFHLMRDIESGNKYRVWLHVWDFTPKARQVDFSFENIESSITPHCHKVQYLPRLACMGIDENTVDWGLFSCLKELNLFGNKISKISSLKLNMLTSLTHLDVSNNHIDEPLSVFAELVQKLIHLQVLNVANNPATSSFTDYGKIDILRLCDRICSADCKLRVLNTEIVAEERASLWAYHGLQATEIQKRLSKLAVELRTNGRPEQMKTLDLQGCGLEVVDLSAFVNLEALSLRNNNFVRLSHVQGLPSMQNLKVFDIRNNKLVSDEDIVDFLSCHPNVLSVLLKGNAAEEALEISRILEMLPFDKLKDVKLRYVDGEELNVDTFLKAAEKQGVTGEQAELYKFSLTLTRRGVLHGSESSTNDLNLDSCSLKYVALRKFSGLKSLVLSNNSIGTSAWMRSGIEKLANLEHLDIRNNAIEAMQAVCDSISTLKKLRAINMDGNPCFMQNTADNRLIFSGKTASLQQTECSLIYLNEKIITIDERITGNEYSATPKNESHLAKFKIELILESIHASSDWQQLNLGQWHLKAIVGLDTFVNLKSLVLRYNQLSSLKGSNLELLPNLIELDLRNNKFTDDENLISELRKYHRLKVLKVKENNFESSKYAENMMYVLRGIEYLDDERNALSLNEKQRRAAGYLLKLVKLDRSRCGTNACVSIDLSGLNLDVDDFNKVVKALCILPVEYLRMSGNNWTKLRNYRLLVIYYVRSLKELDGERVDSEEKANAIRIYNKFQERMASLKGEEMKGDMSRETMKRIGTSQSQPADILKSLAHERIDEKDAKVGSILSKVEIAVNYLQIAYLIIKMPVFENDQASRVRTILSFMSLNIFSLDYCELWQRLLMPLSILLLAPAFFFIYRSNVNSRNWIDAFVKFQVRTNAIIGSSWLITTIASGVIIFLALGNPNQTAQAVIAFVFVLLVLSIVHALVYYLGLVVTRNYQSEMFWYDILRLRRRIVLFLLTITYMPVNRYVLQYFQNFTNNSCIGNPASDPLFWIMVPISFATVLMLPLFFARLIQKGVKQIFLNYGIQMELDKLNIDKDTLYKAIKSNANPELINDMKQRILQKERYIKTDYALKAKQHESASSYLYSSYRINCQMWKIVLMAQRLILLFANTFVISEARYYMAFSICAITAILTVFMRPFSDPSEDFLEWASQISNAIILLIISATFATDTQGNTLFIVWLLFLIFFLIGFVITIAISFFNIDIIGSSKMVANPDTLPRSFSSKGSADENEVFAEYQRQFGSARIATYDEA